MDIRKLIVRACWLLSLFIVGVAAWLQFHPLAGKNLQQAIMEAITISPMITAFCVIAYVFPRAVSGLLNGR